MRILAILLGVSSSGCLFLTRYNEPIELSRTPADQAATVTSQTADWLIYDQADTSDLHIDFELEAETRVITGGAVKVMLGHVLPTEQRIYTPFSLSGSSVYFFHINLLDHVEVSCTNPSVKLKVKEPKPGRTLRNQFRYIKYKRSKTGRATRDNLLRQIDNEHALQIIVTRGHLEPGDVIRVRMGAGGGLPGPTREASLQIITRLDADGDGTFGLLETAPSFDVYSKEVAAVKLIAPSTLRVGEPSHFVLRIEDDYFLPNLARFESGRVELQDIEGLELPSDIPLEGSLETWDASVTEHPIRATAAGVYRITGTATIDGKKLAVRSNPIVVTESDELHAYFGDTHIHSILSYDADRPPEYVYWRMRHQERHDFAFLSDHDMIGAVPFASKTGIAGRTASEWSYARRLADENYQPGTFVTLYAYEWTNYHYGHRNIYFAPTEKNPPLWHHNHASEHSQEDQQTPGELVQHLEGHEFIAIPHSSAWPTGAVSYYWGPGDETPAGDPGAFPQERLLELYSTHGTSEYFDNEYAVDKGHDEVPTKSKLVKSLMNYNIRQAPADSGNFARDVLAAGWRFGFIGSSDMHYLSHIDQAYKYGHAGVWAKELTRESIWEALTSRHTFATTGVRMLVDFNAGEVPMGGVLDAGQPATFHAVIHGTGPLQKGQIIKLENGKWIVAHEVTYEGDTEDAELTWTDENTKAGSIWYLRVRQRDGNYAWASPIWAD